MEFVIAFVVGLIVYTVSLWLAAKIVKERDSSFVEFLIVAVIVSVVGLIPGLAGWAISVVVLFLLLTKLMAMDFVTALLVTVVAFGLRVALVIALLSALAGE